jgi:hypothetical protein
MQESVRRYGDEMQRSHGVPVQIRVGLNSGAVVVRAIDPSQRRPRTLEPLKRLLLRESQVQPVLMVFENLHWIDAETQGFLDNLVESLPTARVLLLVNYRPEARPTTLSLGSTRCRRSALKNSSRRSWGTT